jgi:hypothetical protein
MSFTFRPPTFLKFSSQQLRIELDRALPRLYDAHASLDGTAIKAPAFGTGFVVDTGSATVTGSKLNIQTRLTTVEQVVASIDAGTVATNSTVTATIMPTDRSRIALYVWMPTAAGDTTPIASTTPTVIRWWASGTQEEVQK